MKRRQFLQGAAAIPALSLDSTPEQPAVARAPARPVQRVRPGDPSWPSEASWDRLRREVGGRLIRIASPLAACRDNPDGDACRELFRELKNPYYIGDQPALTQTSGWAEAWSAAPSVYAVAAANTGDVVAAVHFARENHLRLVVKGGGHSYQGTSNAADSLLVWTRRMNGITLHDAFRAHGSAGQPQPAVTVGAGALWAPVYDAVTTQAGRYVQGGGCTTVGVAGLIQSGGFGSFSKNYGLAAAGLLEAEVVTADGAVRIASPRTNPDLFWALKGGGGGSFGVVTRLTLRTRELPAYFGGAFATIKAHSDAAFRDLIARTLRFYHDQLFNRHWGEQISFEPDYTLRIMMVFQGLSRQQAEDVWRPFFASLAAPGPGPSPTFGGGGTTVWSGAGPRAAPPAHDFELELPAVIAAIPARHLWDAGYLRQHYPQLIVADDRPGAPAGNFLWAGDHGQVGWYIHGYRSAWLPASLLRKEQQSRLADALFASSRYQGISLHFNKGLAGAPPEERAAARNTAMNPAVVDAFALAIIAGGGPPAFAGLPGHEPDLTAARRDSRAINQAMDELLKAAPQPGSYVSESDFFEPDWQHSFWGANYPKLAAVKRKYDPDGFFFVHHGVGSEEWSPDGFIRLAGERN